MKQNGRTLLPSHVEEVSDLEVRDYGRNFTRVDEEMLEEEDLSILAVEEGSGEIITRQGHSIMRIL